MRSWLSIIGRDYVIFKQEFLLPNFKKGPKTVIRILFSVVVIRYYLGGKASEMKTNWNSGACIPLLMSIISHYK